MSYPCVKPSNNFLLHLEWNLHSLPGLLISDSYLPCNVILSSFYFTKLPSSFLPQGTCICCLPYLKETISLHSCLLLIIQIGLQVSSLTEALITLAKATSLLIPIPNYSLFCLYRVTILNIWYKWNHTLCHHSVADFFHLACFQGSSMCQCFFPFYSWIMSRVRMNWLLSPSTEIGQLHS